MPISSPLPLGFTRATLIQTICEEYAHIYDAEEGTAMTFCTHKHKMQKDIDLIRKLRDGIFDMPSGLEMENKMNMTSSFIS